jgi:putative transposase
MARPLRICVPGACYHLIARGNARGLVFVDDADRRRFADLLASVVERFGWVVYAYCLMGNHYHLVLETPRANLSAGMRQLNGCYAQQFNRRYARCGHVFQARFRSILVETDSYLLTVCRYVVLNPVRARLCPRPDGWLWSSYRGTAGIETSETFLAVDSLLARFARGREQAAARYRAFVAEGLGEPLEDRILGERLGEDEFLRDRLGCEFLPEVPRGQIEPLPPSLEQLFAGTDPTPIANAYREHGYTLREIAAYLGCHYSTVSRKLREQEGRLRECKT